MTPACGGSAVAIRRGLSAPLFGVLLGLAATLALPSAPASSAEPAQFEVVSQEPGGRVVMHAMGRTTAPLLPVRVVTLHNIFAEAMVACGQSPIGTVEHDRGLPPQLVSGLAQAVSVGQQSTPDFEAILALKPDLILATATEQKQNYALLSAIAPTILVDEPRGDWRGWFAVVGEVLGKQASALAAIQRYDAQAAEAKVRLAATNAGETVLLLRVREKDIRVYGGRRRSGPVLYKDLGLTPHPLVPMAEDNVSISSEIIPQLTADHIFVMVEDKAKMQGLQGTSLWQGLPAYKNGHIHYVDIQPWNQSTGPISFGQIVKDVADGMAGPR